MTTWRMASDLAAVLVPIGVVSAVIAVLCAVVAGIAITRRASGLCGGAVGVWIPAAMLSATAGFASQWLPLLVSAAALVGMLVIGGVVRALMNAADVDWPVRKEAVVTATVTTPAPALTRPNTVRA